MSEPEADRTKAYEDYWREVTRLHEEYDKAVRKAWGTLQEELDRIGGGWRESGEGKA